MDEEPTRQAIWAEHYETEMSMSEFQRRAHYVDTVKAIFANHIPPLSEEEILDRARMMWSADV